MSASNWKPCPKCVQDANTRALAEHDRVRASYGQVPAEQYEADRAALPQLPVDPESFYTFREDYAFDDAETGTLRYYYRGGCSFCGLSTSLNGEKQFWPEP